jgi:hypothetical protein
MTAGLTTEHVFVTPQMAAEYLKSNQGNRPLSRNHVAVLCGAFRRGEMKDNGTPIRFATSGRLLDGQHRLTACVVTGVGFWALVVRGLAEDVFDTIDVGSKRRRVSDVLGMAGESSSRDLASVLACLGAMRSTKTIDGDNSRHNFSSAVAFQLLERHPGIREAIRVCQSARNKIWGVSACSSLYYLFSLVSPSLAEDFIDTICNGSDDRDRPFNRFREGIIRLRISSARPDTKSASARAIKAFNAERKGRRPRILIWNSSELFPQIDGLNYEAL